MAYSVPSVVITYHIHDLYAAANGFQSGSGGTGSACDGGIDTAFSSIVGCTGVDNISFP